MVIKLPRALLSELPQDEIFAQLGKPNQVSVSGKRQISLSALLNNCHTGTRKRPEERLRAAESGWLSATESVYLVLLDEPQCLADLLECGQHSVELFVGVSRYVAGS